MWVRSVDCGMKRCEISDLPMNQWCERHLSACCQIVALSAECIAHAECQIDIDFSA